ncbi:MAG TPA: lipid-A-disaccharide synthase, partial [bacterium]|nr:lipid-A-disaccharide synthase [bacterium]
MEKVSKIAIFSGETSGDQYASLLAYQLKKIFADVEIIGIGGPKLQASGIRIIAEHPLSGTFGFSAVAKTLCKQVKFLHHCIRIIKKENPDLIVFIDNPGFNLTLAKNLYDFKKIYYIPPKIWAHDYQRIFLIKHFFHSVIVIFPFEKPIYEKEGIPAYYGGHPVLDLISEEKDEDFFQKTGIDKNIPLIGFFPGSRQEEIKHILPLLIKAGKIILQKYHVSFAISCAEERLYQMQKKILERENINWPVWKGSTHTLAKNSKVALAASGTINLEIALCDTPMLVFYKMEPVNYTIARIIVQSGYVSPVNIVSGRKVVDEFIQNINWYRFQRVFSEV